MPVCTFLTKVQSYSCKSPYKEQSVADGTPQTHAEDIKGMQAHHKNLIVCTPDIKRQTRQTRQTQVLAHDTQDEL